MKTAASRSRFHLYAAASAAAIGVAPFADAQFTGNYTVEPPAAGTFTGSAVLFPFGSWTGAGTALSGISLTTSLTQVDLSYNGSVGSTSDYTFTVPAAVASNVSFDFVTSASDDGYAGYLVNGSFNSFSGASGTVNYAIGAGESFGFKIGVTASSYTGDASITITNFSVTAVPEPGTTTLLAGCAALGFVGLMARRERRRRAALATV